MFDLQGYHDNYQPAKSFHAVVKYVKKDGNYISNINADVLCGNSHKFIISYYYIIF